MICQKCGAEIKDDAQLCTFCGMPQNSNETNEAESLAEPKDSSANEQVKPNEPNPADQSAQNNECEQGKDLKETDKKQELKLSAIFLAKWLGIFAAVLAVLFVIAFIVGAPADYTGSLYYRVRALVVIAFVCAAPLHNCCCFADGSRETKARPHTGNHQGRK